MYETPEIQGMSIVLVGSFNTSIFQPAWFARHKLIRDAEAENASIEVIMPGLTKFRLDWLWLQVTDDKFVVESVQEPYYEIMRDLVIGTFRLLEHTPIKMMGINTNQHFKMHSEEEWHEFGHALAPKETFWTPVMKQPGLRHLTIQGMREDDKEGYIQTTITPSSKVVPGIYISINNHFDAEENEGCQKLMDTLEQSWSETEQYADKLITHIRNTKP